MLNSHEVLKMIFSERLGNVFFAVRDGRAAVEYIVGGDMDKDGSVIPCGLCEVGHGLFVEQEGLLRFCFCLGDICVACAVDYNLYIVISHCSGNGLRVCHIKVLQRVAAVALGTGCEHDLMIQIVR